MNGGAIKAILMGFKVSNTSKMPNPTLVMRPSRGIAPPRAVLVGVCKIEVGMHCALRTLGRQEQILLGCAQGFGPIGGTGRKFHSLLKFTGTHVTGVSGEHAFTRSVANSL